MSDWQPIETAPKDNKQHILLAGRMGDDCPWRVSTAIWFFDDWAAVEPGFGDPFPWRPTHWMPLPEPPVPEALPQRSPSEQGLNK